MKVTASNQYIDVIFKNKFKKCELRLLNVQEVELQPIKQTMGQLNGANHLTLYINTVYISQQAN